MAPEAEPRFALEEIHFLFAALERLGHPCVLIGGQATCYWARRFQTVDSTVSELAAESDLLSQDVDFQGSRKTVAVLARSFGQQAEVPDFREAFGNLLAGKFTVSMARGPLHIEVLRKVPGLSASEILRLSGIEPFGDHGIRILNPLAVLKAKAWNVVNINKAGRHDLEQLLIMVPCVRAYLRGFLQEGQRDPRVLRAGLYLVEQSLRFTELPTARRAAEKCGVDWSQILPHTFLAAATLPELVRLREKRLPGWLAQLGRQLAASAPVGAHRRLLTILARHAEPLCVPASPATRPSQRQ